MSTQNRYASLWDRLVAQILIEGYCWTWTGHTRRHGGGHRPALSMRVSGVKNPKQFNVARLMCEQIHGPAPTPEHEASHLCLDNWLCICPDHLIWETKKENIARRTARWRTDQQANPDHDPDIDMPGVLATVDEEAPF